MINSGAGDKSAAEMSGFLHKGRMMNVNEECLLNFLSNPEEINEMFKTLSAILPDAAMLAENTFSASVIVV